MNQILYCGVNKTKKQKNNKLLFQFQFIFSILIVFSILTGFVIYISSLNRKQKISKDIIKKYDIHKLYSSNSTNYTSEQSNNKLFGIIEIKKIDIYYPIFTEINTDLLKIAPCKFYGDSLEKNGNICIAAHNYSNSLFFSNINRLNYNDEITIYNSNGKKFSYFVTKIYEVEASNLSPIFDYDNSAKELTLITCNNINKNRIIVKATQ